MANMFSGNREKQVPKSFDDCYKTDSVSKELWHWCEHLERWGMVLFIVIIAIGLFISVTTSIVEKEVIVQEATYWSEAKTELKKVFEFENFIISLIYTAIYAVIEYIIYHIIALLIGSLATIVQSTKITANISLYKYANENNIPIEDVETENEEIKYEETKNCDKAIHEQYVREMTDMYTDSKNAYWEENKLTAGRKLICRHCNKKIAYTSDINWGFPIDKIQNKCCPNCGKIQPISNKECYNCETKFED